MKKIIIIFFALVMFSSSLSAFSGKWKNISSSMCKSGDGLTSFLKENISIQGKSVSWGVYKGKVNTSLTGKKSVGINTNIGFLKGKLKGNQLHFKLDPLNGTWNYKAKCTFKFSKLQSSNKITSNDSLFYCKNEKGEVYSLSKSIYKSCGYREISKVEFDSIKNTKTVKNLYCKDKLGNFHSRPTSLYNSCGTMQQISKVEYDSRKNTKSTKTENNNLASSSIKKDEIYKKAERGDAYSQAVMGWRFQYGEEGYSKNLNESVKWYKKSADQNHAYSLLKLGVFNHSGLGGLKENKKVAFNYFKKAEKYATNKEDKKYVNYNLGLYYQYGYGSVKKDLDKALFYYKEAKKNGDSNADSKISEINNVIASNKKNNKKVAQNNTSLLYCMNEKGEVYSLSKSIYKSCGYREISKVEFDNKKNNKTVVKKQIKKQEVKQTVVVKKDTEGPIIRMDNSFEADGMIARIEGSVSDDNKIVQVTVDGTNVSFSNGRFDQTLFVKPDGQNIIITAMDKFGNKSSKTVRLTRSTDTITAKIFDDLNPTLIKAKINPSAVAIIIGIEEYQTTFAAPFAKKDALAFNDFAHTSLGVPRQNIKLLMNNEAGRTNTLKTLVKWLPKMVKEEETDVYIFFSGHGLASDDGEELYLLPYDGEPDLLEDSTLLRNQLFNRVAKLNPKSVTVFLDTCYSGATRTEEFLVAAKPIFIEAQEQDIPAKFTVFSASAGRETAKVLEEAEHGLFSYYMMKGLEGEADANSDNQITNGELIAFINKNVSRQANQTPQLNGDPDKVLVQW